MDYFTRLGPLSDWHSDTFVTGPAWAVVQKALVPAKDAQTVYVVSDYRSLAGHRPQLRQTLDRNATDTPGRSVLFAHVEGAPIVSFGKCFIQFQCSQGRSFRLWL